MSQTASPAKEGPAGRSLQSPPSEPPPDRPEPAPAPAQLAPEPAAVLPPAEPFVEDDEAFEEAVIPRGAPTSAQLRREALGLLARLSGDPEPWRAKVLAPALAHYLGPWLGMSLVERWERMGPIELSIFIARLEDAEERRAIQLEHAQRKERTS